MTDFSASHKKYLDSLFKMLIDTLDEKVLEIRDELREQADNLAKQQQNFMNIYEEKFEKIEKENKNLQETINKLQRKVRKNNLVIYGVSDREENLLDYVTKLFTEVIKVSTTFSHIRDIYRVGKSTTNKPVIVEFNSYNQKLQILKNAKRLKGRNIYIDQDLCDEDRNTKKTLVKHLKVARSKGIVSYIKGSYIYIDGKSYTVESLKGEHYEEIDTEEGGKREDTTSTQVLPREEYQTDETNLGEGKVQQEKVKPDKVVSSKVNKNTKQILTRSAGNTNIN